MKKHRTAKALIALALTTAALGGFAVATHADGDTVALSASTNSTKWR